MEVVSYLCRNALRSAVVSLCANGMMRMVLRLSSESTCMWLLIVSSALPMTGLVRRVVGLGENAIVTSMRLCLCVLLMVVCMSV